MYVLIKHLQRSGVHVCANEGLTPSALIADASSVPLASTVFPTARYQVFCAEHGSPAGGPASKSGRGGGPHAPTCKRTWFLLRAKLASNHRAKIFSRVDPAQPKEHPTTFANTAPHFFCARPPPASSCSAPDQVAPDVSGAARKVSTI